MCDCGLKILTPVMVEYAWQALDVTGEIAFCQYSSPKKKQVCYRCEDQDYAVYR